MPVLVASRRTPYACVGFTRFPAVFEVIVDALGGVWAPGVVV
jgi:hypothetical protein